jgi:hypothetical protein
MLKFLLGAVVGLAVGIAGTIFVYPFVFLSGIVATETLDASAKTRVAEGTFIHANPSDPIHYGSGKVTVFSDTVRLEPDFEVGPGPKFKVLLHTAKGIKSAGDIAAARYVDLGPLRAFKGSQNYAIPPELRLADFQSVVIWCEAFNVLISPADLARR